MKTSSTPATIFQDLHRKAMAWCRDFEQYKEDCKVFGEQLRVDYITYLGARSADVEFHVLDERLERMASEGTTLSPRLKVGDDGFLYFGLTLFFKEAGHCLDEHIRVGVQRSRGQWKVRWGRIKSTYAVNGAHAAFFDRVTAPLADKFITPFHKVRGQLGFVPYVSNDEHLVLAPVGGGEDRGRGRRAFRCVSLGPPGPGFEGGRANAGCLDQGPGSAAGRGPCPASHAGEDRHTGSGGSLPRTDRLVPRLPLLLTRRYSPPATRSSR